MNKLLTARIFSFFVIFSMLLSALGMPNIVARAAGVGVEGTITPYKVGSTSGTGSGSYISFSHTTGTTTFSDRLLLVGVSWNASSNSSPITGVTFTPTSGTAITMNLVIHRKHSANPRYAAIYSLVDPPTGPTGQAGTVTVTFGNSVGSGIIAGAANLYGVDTITPLGSPNGADGTGTAVSVTVNGLAGDEFIFDTVFLGGSGPSITVDPSQTPLWNATQGQALGAASTEQAAGGSVLMSWTGSSGPWVDVAVPVFPTCIGARNLLTASDDGHGTVTLNPTGGSYCSDRSVTVTLTPVPATGYLFSGWSGTNAGEINSTGVGVNTVYTIVMNGSKSVMANFAPESCTDITLPVDEDTFLSASTTTIQTYNYGATTTLEVDRTTGASRRTALLRWNTLGGIPSSAFIKAASLQLQVTNSSTYAYPLNEMARTWVEGNLNGTASSSGSPGANWNALDYQGGTSWYSGGAGSSTGATIDHGGTNLWDSTGLFSGTAPFSTTVPLNADGRTVVQRWVTGGANNGVIIQFYELIWGFYE